MQGIATVTSVHTFRRQRPVRFPARFRLSVSGSCDNISVKIMSCYTWVLLSSYAVVSCFVPHGPVVATLSAVAALAATADYFGIEFFDRAAPE